MKEFNQKKIYTKIYKRTQKTIQSRSQHRWIQWIKSTTQKNNLSNVQFVRNAIAELKKRDLS